MSLEGSSLIEIIQRGDNKRALEIIKSGNFEDTIGFIGYNTLLRACLQKMNDVALALIKSGKVDPGYINPKGIQSYTALIIACTNKMTNVALELIKTGKSKPEHVDYRNATALIIACSNNMTNVALELIKTGKSNPEQVDTHGNTAYYYAVENDMIDVVKALNIINPPEDLPNIKVVDSCKGEKDSPISLTKLEDGKTVLLSDGYCYSFDDIVDLYKNNSNKFESPMTRARFTYKDIKMVRRLKSQGYGSSTGGKKSRKIQKKKTKKTKNHKRKTRKVKKKN